jgi:hypothetical protein
MSSGDVSRPGPSGSQPLAREHGHTKPGRSEQRRRDRTPGSRPQTGVTVQRFESISSTQETQELRSEFPSVISEIVKEDLTYRAQARRFLWEFFD